ncbi:MAG: TetR/AcrR family transcriptional regulator [Actinomycetota bacterium]
MSGPQRRAQLMRVARDVFAQRGYAAASIEEIAAQAAVSKPVVYEHFGSKEAIYGSVVEREIDELVGRIKRALVPGHPRRAITHAVDAFLSYIEEEEAGFTILVRDAPIGSGEASLPSVLDEIARSVEKLLATELKERGYDPKMAPVLSRSLVGMVALPGQWWLKVGRPRREVVADHIVNLAWNGLAALEGREST